jgi:uridine phosphorylase
MQMMSESNIIKESELIINDDGSIYHLNLKPEFIPENIILVGDPGRVERISRHFSKIEIRSANREIFTHIGSYNGVRLMVMSTGMGTDNIDIIMNELDALVNVDFKTRTVKNQLTSLNIVRLGTSGAVQPDIEVGSHAASVYGLGLDGLLPFYKSEHVTDQEMSLQFIRQVGWPDDLPYPYFSRCSDDLFQRIAGDMISGITATAPGFFGPQGRVVRMPLKYPHLMNKFQHFRFGDERIINFEMETSALYGLGRMLGHSMLTVCAVIANRATKKYIGDYKPVIDELIEKVLDRMTR